jgi:hypothetical protein
MLRHWKPWIWWTALRRGHAQRVIFYYYGEEPTYLEEAFVTVYRNGMVEVEHKNEHVSTHVQNVEILWRSRGALPLGGGLKSKNLTLIQGENQRPR